MAATHEPLQALDVIRKILIRKIWCSFNHIKSLYDSAGRRQSAQLSHCVAVSPQAPAGSCAKGDANPMPSSNIDNCAPVNAAVP